MRFSFIEKQCFSPEAHAMHTNGARNGDEKAPKASSRRHATVCVKTLSQKTKLATEQRIDREN
jgi:hypothetical protein